MDHAYSFVFGTVVVALVYAIGYSFLNGYFGYFNIFMAELDLSLQEIFVHSYVAIVDALLTPSLFAFFAFVAIFLAGYFLQVVERRGKVDRSLLLRAGSCLVVLFGFYALFTAQENGKLHAEGSIGGLNWSRPNTAVVTYLEEVTGSPVTRLYSIYNSTNASYYLHLPRRGRPPWTIRYDREHGTIDRYLLD